MKKRNIYRLRPFFLALTTLTLLVGLSVVESGFNIGDYEFKPINVLSNIETRQAAALTMHERKNLTYDSLGVSKQTADSLHISLDSLLNAEKEDLRITDYSPMNEGSLENFFKALENTEVNKGKVRIAYFGDSMIEGDLITQTLRDMLQRMFGGKGVGFVPAVSKTAGFRSTIINKFTDNWQIYSFLQRYRYKKVGLSGFVFNPNINRRHSDSGVSFKKSWVQFAAPKATYINLQEFDNVEMFYGRSSSRNSISVSSDKTNNSYALDGKSTVNKLILNSNQAIKKISVLFNTDSLLDVYGFNFDSPQGLFVDNYSVRGNSGTPLQGIPSSVLADFSQHLKYDLIILQYGLNITSPKIRDFSWYEKGMINAINHIKTYYPNANILLVGVGDRSYKHGTEMETMPSIPLLVEAQRRIAQKTGAAFWNLFQAMGGYNSMKQWVDTTAPLANKDYTHVNHRGAEKIGTLLYNNLLNEYKIYKSKSK